MKKAERIGGNVASYVDDRTGAAKWLRKNLTKVSQIIGPSCSARLFSILL